MPDTKKSANVETQVFDINLIYIRAICPQVSNRDIDIDYLMSHELASLPIAPFADSCHMRISTSKSNLKT